LKNVGTDDLLKMKRSPAVYVELLTRANVRDEYRYEAVTALAKDRRQSQVSVLLDAIRDEDKQQARPDSSVLFDLVRLLTERNPAELTDAKEELESLATGAKQPVTRQLAFVALIAAEGKVDGAWAVGTKSILSEGASALERAAEATRLGRRQADHGTVCADRVARPSADADSGRGRSL
jgi:hypothetical protein